MYLLDYDKYYALMIKSINALIVGLAIRWAFLCSFLPIVPFLLSSGFASYLFLSPFHDFIIYQLWYTVNAFMQLSLPPMVNTALSCGFSCLCIVRACSCSTIFRDLKTLPVR